jgi:hypothetical protein
VAEKRDTAGGRFAAIQFVYYLVCVGMLIAGLRRLAEVRPTTEWTLLLGWPALILVSVWFIGSCLPRLRR